MTHTETWQYPEDLAVPPHFVCPDSVDKARRDGIHRDPCRSWAEKTTWEGCKTFESWENLPSRLIEATHAGFLNINFTDFQQQTLAGLWLQPLNLKHMLVIGDHHPISRVFRTCLKPPAKSSLVLYTSFLSFSIFSYGFPMIFPSTPYQNSWMNLAPAPSTANLPRHGASPAIHTSLSCDCGKWSVNSGMIYMSYPLVMSK